MKCPHCNQEITALTPDRRCMSCGMAVHVARQEAVQLAILTGAFFVSVLVYGAVAWGMEGAGHQPPMPGASFTYPAVGMGLLSLWLIHVVTRALVKRPGVQTILQAAIVAMALTESLAVIGLTLYILTGSIQDFVILLGMSVIGFVVLATQIPSYIAMIEKRKLEGG